MLPRHVRAGLIFCEIVAFIALIVIPIEIWHSIAFYIEAGIVSVATLVFFSYIVAGLLDS